MQAMGRVAFQLAKLQDELSAGKADAVTKAAFQDAVAKVEKAEKALDKMNQEVTELAQKAANILGKPQTAKTLGQLAAESDEAKTYRGGTVQLCTMAGPLFAKANVTSDPASAGVLVDPYRVPGVRIRNRPGVTSDMRVVIHGASDRPCQIIGGPAEIDCGRGLELVVEEYSA